MYKVHRGHAGLFDDIGCDAELKLAGFMREGSTKCTVEKYWLKNPQSIQWDDYKYAEYMIRQALSTCNTAVNCSNHSNFFL